MSNYHPVSGMGERSRQSRLVSIVPCLPEREGCPGRVTDFFRLPQRVPLLEEGKRQQNPSVLNQRFRDAALMGQLAVFLFLWLFFAVFLTHGRKQASNPAPLCNEPLFFPSSKVIFLRLNQGSRVVIA